MKENNSYTYDDILHEPHPISKRRTRMASIDRAAQFAPFAALSGHKEAIYETQRLIDDKRILDEYQKSLLNDALQNIQCHIKQRPLVRLTYFEADKHKSGGTYLTICKPIKKIDEYNHVLVFMDQTNIKIDDIYDVEMTEEIQDKLNI